MWSAISPGFCIQESLGLPRAFLGGPTDRVGDSFNFLRGVPLTELGSCLIFWGVPLTELGSCLIFWGGPTDRAGELFNFLGGSH